MAPIFETSILPPTIELAGERSYASPIQQTTLKSEAPASTAIPLNATKCLVDAPLNKATTDVVLTTSGETQEELSAIRSQRQFLEKLLDTFNNRRAAVDIRSTIICTISLALLGFVLTQGDILFKGMDARIRELSTFLLLIPAFLTTIYSISLIAPLGRSSRAKKTFVRSATWFYLIPTYAAEEYTNHIRTMDDSQLRDLTASQVYELAELLKMRYTRLNRAVILLYISLADLVLFFAGRAIWMFFTQSLKK